MIYANPQIWSLRWESILNIFTPVKGVTYQPIRVLSYAVDYHFWELNPVGYHITSILFYIFTCITVFFSLHSLSTGLRNKASPDSHERVGILGSLLFAAHPVHVEAVTWLAARKEVLQGFFFFLAFYLYLKGREGEGGKKILYFGSVLFSILLAILSKPAAIVFPAGILVYEIACQGKNRWVDFLKKYWLFFAISIFISMIFTFILIKVMIEAGGAKPYRGGTFFSNLLVSVYAFLYNIKLLTFTTHYSAAYTIDVPNPILGLRTFIFIAITFFLFGLSFWTLKKTKAFFFSFLFFFITLLPYLNIIPLSTLLADRYVFLGSFSYCFLLGIGFDNLYNFRNKFFSEGFFKYFSVALFLFIFISYSFMTVQQNRVWKNSFTLWADAVEKYPESDTANALMGVVYMDLGMDQEAVRHLEKAVEILPYDYQSRNNLGIVYGRIGQPEKAFNELMTAIHLAPDNDSIKINLSVFYQMQKEFEKSEGILKYLISKHQNPGQLHFRLGMLYKEMGRYDDSIAELKKSTELSPHIINHYEEIGNIYLSKLKDLEKAKFYYMKGIEMVPQAKSIVEELRWTIQDLER
jgi:tetratricopeptide (TPR) repeat protein